MANSLKDVCIFWLNLYMTSTHSEITVIGICAFFFSGAFGQEGKVSTRLSVFFCPK